jgi:hypothetical protein
MASFFSLDPEVAGELGERTVLDASAHPPIVTRLHYHVQSWLGDDVIQSFPCFVVTERLRRALEERRFSGYHVEDAEVTVDEDFRTLSPGMTLPRFYWLRVDGRPGVDDFGVSGTDYCLVVSARVLVCMRQFALKNCSVQPFSPAS